MHTDINTIDDIRILVDSFYKRAAKDDLLSPIFSRLADTSSQRESLYVYWNEVLLSPAPNADKVFPEHIRQMFSPRHFIRWLTLFLETIDLLYAGATAEKAKVMVIRKCEEFQAGLAITYF